MIHLDCCCPERRRKRKQKRKEEKEISESSSSPLLSSHNQHIRYSGEVSGKTDQSVEYLFIICYIIVAGWRSCFCEETYVELNSQYFALCQHVHIIYMTCSCCRMPKYTLSLSPFRAASVWNRDCIVNLTMVTGGAGKKKSDVPPVWLVLCAPVVVQVASSRSLSRYSRTTGITHSLIWAIHDRHYCDHLVSHESHVLDWQPERLCSLSYTVIWYVSINQNTTLSTHCKA